MTFNKIRITIIASEIENAKKRNNIEKRELTNLPLALAGKTNINNESIELTKNRDRKIVCVRMNNSLN